MNYESSHAVTFKDADSRRAFAVEVVERLRAKGFQAYWAGGCVRDLLMGHEPSDYDVATDARPEQVMTLYRRTFAVGASFGVVRVLGDDVSGDIEVATFRSDGVYSDGRRPDSVVYSTAEFDASRRDFTINGLFYDPLENQVIDYVGGREDLSRKVLRAIGDPVARFNEDKLRLLRAVRFTARFDLKIDPATMTALEQMAAEVTQVAPERIGQEWRKMLVDKSRVKAIELADQTGLLIAILPQTESLKRGGGAAWAETIRVLAALPDNACFPLVLASLLRLVEAVADNEKALKRWLDLPQLILEVADKLKLANAERDLAGWLISNAHSLLNAEAMPRSALKRLLASSAVDDLVLLHRAIAQGTTGDLAHVDYCVNYLRDQPDGPIDPPPILTGHDLMKHGLKPGPRFAGWLETVRDAQLERAISTREEALSLVDRVIAEGSP